MNKIEFSQQQKELLATKIQTYFSEELNYDIGQFDALFFMDFISDEIGAYFYNQGLFDARALFEQRIENIGDAIYELEKPTEA